MTKLYDPFRRIQVSPTPEEIVRQKLLQTLVDQGYPKHLIAVEKQVGAGRRADIICYGNSSGTLSILLMIECKAVPLTQDVIDQVTGYNHYIGAPFVAIANSETVRTGWREKDRYIFQEGIPTYEQLCRILKKI
ncbi:MAG: type I restriction enzyme HsdR N-terminal domain-containing protein [Simkaniaceae bacterium]|nr:type I restriction enzyme HsdR N-terminal domain-containing protein [Simkaniaceae bacterium]